MEQKFWHILHMIIFFACPTCHLLLLSFLFASPSSFMAAGERCILLDLIFAIVSAINALRLVVGASYLDLTDWETIVCICISPLMVFLIMPIVEFSVIVWTFVNIYRDWRQGGIAYQMTKKGAE